MRISENSHRNPNLYGYWVENTHYPSAGAGQVQHIRPQDNACLIEGWQKPVVDNLSLNGVYHKSYTLKLAEYLYMGHYGNTLYYVHQAGAYQMEFVPTSEIATVHDFDEAHTHFSTRKAYLAEHHHAKGKQLTPDDEYFIFDCWLETGSFQAMIPYILPMDTGNERQQADGYLNDLRLADALVTV
jgi:hypothetical protein